MFKPSHIFYYTILLTIYTQSFAQNLILEPIPEYTHEKSVKLKGSTCPLCVVVVEGGASKVEAMTDESGYFIVDVHLKPDQENRLTVKALKEWEEFGRQELKIIQVKEIPPPDVKPLPKFTTAMSIKLKGKACPLCLVTVTGGSSRTQAVAREDGTFEMDVFLKPDDENKLHIRAEARGRTSPPTVVSIIQIRSFKVSIGEKPFIETSMIPKYTKEFSVKIKGKTAPFALVEVKGGSSEASAFSDEEGDFEVEVFLKPDSLNVLRLTAEDMGGFISPPAVIKIYQSITPPPAPKIGRVTSPTNRKYQSIYGIARPGTTIIVTGGELPSAAKVKDNGEFAVKVALKENTINELRITARDQAGNISPYSEVIILHDSIPPPPPTIEDFPRETMDSRATIRGLAEPRCSVSAGGVNIRASSYGDFGLPIKIKKYIRQKRVNKIMLFAEDAAGNRSIPSVVHIVYVPMIRRQAVEFLAGFHSFLPSEFFDANRDRWYLTTFFGPSAELSYDFLVRKGTGPSIGLVLGAYTSFERGIEFDFVDYCIREIREGRGEECALKGDPRELKTMNLTSFYTFPEVKFVLLAEFFDFFVGAGAGLLSFIKDAPYVERKGESTTISKRQDVFHTLSYRISLGSRFFFSEKSSIIARASWIIARIKDVNEFGHDIDAGGALIFVGFGLHF